MRQGLGHVAQQAGRIATLAVAVGAMAAVLSGCLLSAIGPPSGAAPLRYRDEVFASYTTIRDLQYGAAPGRNGTPEALRLDLYQPAGDTASVRPVVVWAHGGGFSGGDKRDDEFLVAPLVRRGFVAVSINYRLLSNGCSGSTPTTECENATIAGINDAQAAVRWLRANAAAYRIDPGRIAVAGYSAGGVIATGVGLLSDQPGTSGNPGYSSRVKAWVSVAGGLPGDELAAIVDPSDPPGYLFSGTADPVVPHQWSVDTAQALSDAGGLAVLNSRQGGDHGLPDFSLLITQQANFYSFVMNPAVAAP